MTHELGFGQSELSWGDTYMKLPRIQAILDVIQTLRVKRVRMVLSWGMIESHLNQFNWANADRAIGEALDRGIKPLLCCSTPRPTTYTKSAANYSRFVQEVATRYGVTGFTYNGKFYPPMTPVEIEIFNEPNLSSFWSPVRPADYTEFLKAAYASIKAVAPGTLSLVVSAGLAGAVGNDNLGWVWDSVRYAQGMMDAGAVGNFDAFGFHAYSSDEAFTIIAPDINGNVFIKEQKVRDMLDANGFTGDIWWTEWGYGTSEVTFDQAAAYDETQWGIYQSLPRRGPAFRYDLSDSANKPTSKNSSYGVTDYFLVPKPSYYFFDTVNAPAPAGGLASVGTLSVSVISLKKPRLSSEGSLTVKLFGRVGPHLGSVGTLSVNVLTGGNRPHLASVGTLSVDAVQQRKFFHDFSADGTTKPTSIFTEFGVWGYTVGSGKASNALPTLSGMYYDGGIYDTPTLTSDQFVEVELASPGSFADRSMVAVARAAADGSQAIYATGRWGGSDSTQILMWDGTVIQEMANGTMKFSSIHDKLGIRCDGDVYTVTKNGVDTDCQWIDTAHLYSGRNNKHVGFGFQHKRVNGVNYNAPGILTWAGQDLRGVEGIIIPSRNGTLASVGTLSARAMGARNGNLSGTGVLSNRVAALKKPALSSTGTLSVIITGTPHGNLASTGTLSVVVKRAGAANLSGAGTLTTKAVALKKPALSGVGTLSAIAIPGKTGNLSGAGTLSTKAAALKKPALASTGTLTTAAAALKKPALTSTGTLSVSATKPVTVPTVSNGLRTGLASTRNFTAAFGSGYVPQAGDIIYFFARAGATSQTSTTPTGWTNPLGGNTVVSATGVTAVAVYHVVTSAEATAGTTTYTASNLWDASQTGACYACVVRGVDQTTPIDDSESLVGTSTTTHQFSGLTGANLSTSSVVVDGVASAGSGTYTDPAGYTLLAKNTAGQNQGAMYRNNTATVAGTNVAAQNITSSATAVFVSITTAFAGV